MTATSVPALRRGIRRGFDAARDAHVLLGPERVIVLDEIAVAITERLDGKSSIAEISQALAVKFEADVTTVEPDVLAFVQALVDKGLATS